MDYLYYQGEKSLSEIAHCLYITILQRFPGSLKAGR
jgi:hypothetical protein